MERKLDLREGYTEADWIEHDQLVEQLAEAVRLQRATQNKAEAIILAYHTLKEFGEEEAKNALFKAAKRIGDKLRAQATVVLD